MERGLRKDPYSACMDALLLAGFIKETVVPFLAAVIATRLLLWFGRARQGSAGRAELIGELKIACLTAAAAGPFLFFRTVYGNPRSIGLAAGNAGDPVVYATLARAFLEQWGLFAPLALIGLILLIRRRRPAGLASAFFFSFHTIVHLLDFREFIGYSRFQLLLVPACIAASLGALNSLYKTRRGLIGAAAALAAVLTNLALSPVHLDGSKKPHWGSYLCDTGEHYYPYRTALAWVDSAVSGRAIALTGHSYPFTLLAHYPLDNNRLTEILIAPDHRGDFRVAASYPGPDSIDALLVHVPYRHVPPARIRGYQIDTVFANRAHRLAFYRNEARSAP
jgi:hypothetical protein